MIHEVRNAGAEAYRLAPWALTMLAQGGAGIHGFPPRGTHPKELEHLKLIWGKVCSLFAGA